VASLRNASYTAGIKWLERDIADPEAPPMPADHAERANNRAAKAGRNTFAA
jgi:hypothetical protein